MSLVEIKWLLSLSGEWRNELVSFFESIFRFFTLKMFFLLFLPVYVCDDQGSEWSFED